MQEIPAHRADQDRSTVVDAPPPPNAIVVRSPSRPTVPWHGRITAAAQRASELARNPAVAATAAATATVAADLAIRALRRAGGTPRPSHAVLTITGVIVQRVDVVHHLADPVGARALPPS